MATLEWSAPDGAPRRARFAPGDGAAPRPASLVAADDGALGFAELLASELARQRWGALVVPASAFGAARADRALTAELEAGLAALERARDVDGARLALVGVGAIGTQAFLCACASRRARAVVDVGGALAHETLDAEHPVQPLDMLLNLSAPALLVHAAADERFGAAQARAAAQRIERALRSVERVELEGRTADFLDPRSPGYHAERADRAARAIVDFLRAATDEP